jgi:hypothetical protein
MRPTISSVIYRGKATQRYAGKDSDEQDVQDLNLEQMFSVFDAADKGKEFSKVVAPVSKTNIDCGSVSEIPNGERKLIDTDSGVVIVTNVKGSFYAVNAKCPHLGLPMKVIMP